jgi:hypothetical protein
MSGEPELRRQRWGNVPGREKGHLSIVAGTSEGRICARLSSERGNREAGRVGQLHLYEQLSTGHEADPGEW